MSDAEPNGAYRTLDGLRGVAALIVVTRHAGDVVPGELCPESFLAVDLFFLLSGFVVALAYEQRLLAGRSLAGFMKTRLIRLYPLYALGIGLGLAARVATGGALDVMFLIEAVVIGLLMLPAIPPLPMGSSTLNGPTWTLAPELLVNLVYAALVRRLSRPALWVVVGTGALGLVASEAVYGTLDGGWSVDRFPLLAARLAFSFFLGVAMHRNPPPRRVGALAAWASLAALGFCLAIHPAEAMRRLFELGAVIGLFPAIVAVAIRREPGPIGGAAFRFLGLVSYAVYVLHQPLGALTGVALTRLHGPAGPTAVTAVAFLAAIVVAAALADKLYDQPVRRRLSTLWPRRNVALEEQVA
ncbi:acyltransferase [Caulobacter sp. S45]|uniref:acyltransferase family protein n=1 Tax=Caulobacter sp. S45 TaxID=1641861 RepID=UPI0015774A80|nr:acyltransferase [Caulobacter sp. S45]